MRRTAIVLFAIVIGLSVESSQASVESNYYGRVAARETGAYEMDGTVYFHVQFGIKPAADDSACRRRAMLAVRKFMVEWIVKRACGYETLPESIRKIDTFCTKYGSDIEIDAFNINVAGRGFTVESDGKYAYGLAVPLKELNREAEKGVPGRTENDIVSRWKKVCARELNGPSANAFLEDVGCGSIDSVPGDIAEKLSAECAFLEGWNQKSQIVAMLKTTKRLDYKPEDMWLEGLSLVADIKDGKMRLENSGMRLYAAISETPGSPILWCYLGEYLKSRRLYRISAVAYKNAICLSSNIGLYTTMKSIAPSLAKVYRSLGKDALADGFEMLSRGM